MTTSANNPLAQQIGDPMTNDLADLILEELRALRHGQQALRHGQEALRADIADVRISARQSETVPGLAYNLVGHLQLQIASQTSRVDRYEEKLRRIERQLDPVLNVARTYA